MNHSWSFTLQCRRRAALSARALALEGSGAAAVRPWSTAANRSKRNRLREYEPIVLSPSDVAILTLYACTPRLPLRPSPSSHRSLSGSPHSLTHAATSRVNAKLAALVGRRRESERREGSFAFGSRTSVAVPPRDPQSELFLRAARCAGEEE